MFKAVSIFALLVIAHSVHSFEGDTDNRSQRMNAWQVYKYGKHDQFKFSTDAPIPKITKSTEVFVEVLITSINALDVIMIGGYGRNVLNVQRLLSGIREFPLTLGRDFVGIVKAKGKRVKGINVGDKVWGVTEPHQVGTFADYVVLDQRYVTLKPETIDDIGAAGIMYAGLTAWSSFNCAGFFGRKNLKVAILGASGGVGTLAVQIAKAENAVVTATCSKSAIPLVEKLGADRVIDYTAENVEEQFRGHHYDIILDCAGLGPKYARQVPWKYTTYITLDPPLINNTDTAGLLPGGVLSVLNLLQQNAQSLLNRKGIVQWGIFQAQRKGIEYLTNLAANKKLIPVVDSVFEFESADKALQKMSKGHLRGKIILKKNT